MSVQKETQIPGRPAELRRSRSCFFFCCLGWMEPLVSVWASSNARKHRSPLVPPPSLCSRVRQAKRPSVRLTCARLQPSSESDGDQPEDSGGLRYVTSPSGCHLKRLSRRRCRVKRFSSTWTRIPSTHVQAPAQCRLCLAAGAHLCALAASSFALSPLHLRLEAARDVMRLRRLGK